MLHGRTDRISKREKSSCRLGAVHTQGYNSRDCGEAVGQILDPNRA